MKKSLPSLLVLIFLGLSNGISAQTCMNSLLQNGDFTSNLTSWNGQGGTIQNGALQLCQTGDIMRQTISAEVGKNYQFHYTAKTLGTNQNVLFGLKFLDASWIPLDSEYSSFDSPGAFSSNFIEKVAPAGTVYVEVSIGKTNNGCVEVEEVCLTTGGGAAPCDNDTEAPIISNCPSDISLSTATTSVAATWTAPTATDNCGTPTLTTSHVSGSSFPIGSTQVVYMATDAKGNTAVCSFTVQVSQSCNTPINQGTNTLLLTSSNSTIEDTQPGSIVPNSLQNTNPDFDPYCWTQNGQTNITRPYIKFDFSHIPAGATVESAELILYNNPDKMATNQMHSGDNDFWVERVTSAWSDQTLTWNNQPNITSQNRVYVPASTDPMQDYVIDVSQLVKDILQDQTIGNQGLRMRLVTEQVYRSVLLCSSDFHDCNRHPRLRITLADNPPTACTNNLLQNSSFDQNLNNWNGQGGTIQNGALQLCQTGDVMRQTISAEAGKTYQFHYTAKTLGTNQNVLFGLKFLDASWIPLDSEYSSFDSPGAFSSNFIEKVAPAGSVWVEVSIGKTNSGCVEVEEVCLTTGDGIGPCDNDTGAPILANCPSDIRFTSDVAGAHPLTWTAPTATDNCSQVTLTSTHQSGSDFYPNQAQTVVYTATDAAENVATCSFVVEITAGSTPTSCANNLLQNGDFENGAQQWQITGASIQNGQLQLCTIGEKALQTIQAEAGKNYRFQYSAKTLGVDKNVLFGLKFLDATWNPVGAQYSSFDSPDAFSSDFIEAIAPNNAVWIEVNILKQNTGCVQVDNLCLSTDFAPDPCFIDEIPPVFTICPKDTTIYTTEQYAIVEWVQPEAVDNCSAVTISGNQANGSFFYKYPYTIIQTAKDESGNIATCTFTVTVRDPNSGGSCADNLLVNGDFQNGLSNWENNGATVDAGFLKLCSSSAKIAQKIPAMDTINYVLAFSMSTSSPLDSILSSIRFFAADGQTELGFFQKNLSSNGYLQNKFLGLIPPIGTAFLEIGIQSFSGNCVEVGSICIIPETPNDCAYDYIPPTIIGCPNDTIIYTSTLPAFYRYPIIQASDNCSVKSFPGGTYTEFKQLGEKNTTITAIDQANNYTVCTFKVNVLLENIPIQCSNSLLKNSEFSTTNDWSIQGGTIQNGNLQLCKKGDVAQQTIPAEPDKIYKLQYNAKTLEIGKNVLFGIKFLSASYLPIGDMYSSFDSPSTFSSNFIQAAAPPGTAWVEASIIKENDGCIEVNEVCLSKRQETFTPAETCSTFEMDGIGTFAGFSPTGEIKIYRDYLGVKKMFYLTPTGEFLRSENLEKPSYSTSSWYILNNILRNTETGDTIMLPQSLIDQISYPIAVFKSASKYLFGFSKLNRGILLETDLNFNILKTDSTHVAIKTLNARKILINNNGQIIIEFGVLLSTGALYADPTGSYFKVLNNDFKPILEYSGLGGQGTWLAEQVFTFTSHSQGSLSGQGSVGTGSNFAYTFFAPTFAFNSSSESSYSNISYGRGAYGTSNSSGSTITTRSFPSNQSISVKWGSSRSSVYFPPSGFYGSSPTSSSSSSSYGPTATFLNNKLVDVKNLFGKVHVAISTNDNNFLILGKDKKTLVQKVDCTNPTAPDYDVQLSISSTELMPGQWKPTQFSIKLENKGTKPSTNIKVQVPPQSDVAFRDKLAYISHTAGANSSFNSWTGIWEIPSLAAGESITLNYEGFTKIATAIPIFAQVVAQNEQDADSSPNNNTNGIPSEDDEALLVLNDVQNLQKGNFIAPEQGDARIFPNPASQVLFVDLEDYDGLEVFLTLVDALGRSVQSQEVAGSHSLARAEMDVRGLENGLYFLRIESLEKRPLVVRVLVEHGR